MKKYYKIGIVVLIIILLVLLFFVLKKDNKKLEIKELSFSSGIEKLEKLEELNINKYAWLQVEGTNIDVPILTIPESTNEYSHGWISSTSIGMKTREVLVGHNVLNVSSSPMVNNEILTDFEDLMAFSYYDFAKDNMYISYTKDRVDKIFIIYAIGFYDYGYDSSEGLTDLDEIDNYIKKVKKNSIYNYDVDVNNTDNILTIKTCTRYFGVNEKQQFQIDARELRKDEDILKYNVKKTKLYKEYNLKDTYEKNNSL